MKNRLFSILLLAALMLCGISCGDGSTDSTVTGSAAEESTAERVPTWIDTLPDDLDFGGEVIRIGAGNIYSTEPEYEGINECAPALDSYSVGDIVNEAVTQRNRYVEDKLNIRIESEDYGSWNTFTADIEKLVMAGDTTYDAYCANTYGLFLSSINGLLLPLNEIGTLDLNNPWWDGEVIRMGSLGSPTVYFASGAINYLDDYSTSIIVFNKNICSRIDMEEPYQLVRDGKWTLDVLSEYVKSYSVDLDGDGKMGKMDAYGLSTNSSIASFFCIAAGEPIVIVDDGGNVTLNQSVRMIDVLDKLCADLLSKGNQAVCVAERTIGYDAQENLFPEGRALFLMFMVNSINRMRMSMEDDFGVLPMPKYDEAQDKYYNLYNTAWATAYALPTSCENPEQIGTILDVMGYYSEDTVYPAVIEKNVLAKGIRDEDSAEMLDLIFRNKAYDLGQWGSSVYGSLCDIATNGKNNYASKIASNIKKTEKEFGAVSEYYDFN